MKADPNQTYEGSAHSHDWWGSDLQVEILSRQIPLGTSNVCVGTTIWGCDGAPENGRFIRFLSDPDPNARPNIVFQGTGRMEIKVNVQQVILPFALALFGPGINAGNVRFVVDQPQKTFNYEITNDSHTDPPHVRLSSFYFRMESIATGTTPRASLWLGPMQMTVIVHRDPSRPTPIDPPHPDHWNGTTSRVIFEKTTTHQNSVTVSGTVYPYPQYAYHNGDDCAGPACKQVINLEINQTVPILSDRIVVTLKWTNGAPSTGTKLYVEHCGADENCVYTTARWTRSPLQTDGTAERVFEIPVRSDQWDTPYTLEGNKGTYSKWKFRWSATSSNPAEVALFQGTVSWHVEVFKAVPV